MDPAPFFLHAAHQVRETLDELRLVSWLAIGLAVGALVLTWGRLLTWLRALDEPGPRILSRGADDRGLFFEIAAAGGASWTVETTAGRVLPLAQEPGSAIFRTDHTTEEPTALISSGGVRLTL